MTIEPFVIDTEADAKAYLTDLLRDPKNRSMAVVEAHSARLIKDPAIKTYFMITAAEMLASRKGES